MSVAVNCAGRRPMRDGKRVSNDAQMVIPLQRDFQHLVHKIGFGLKLKQRLLEQLQLEVARHGVRAIEADKSGMQVSAGILPFLFRA